MKAIRASKGLSRNIRLRACRGVVSLRPLVRAISLDVHEVRAFLVGGHHQGVAGLLQELAKPELARDAAEQLGEKRNPSQPAEFITVALTRSDQGTLQVSEV